MGEQCIVLDRDGTLIDVVRDEETGVITTAFHPDQIRLLPGVLEGLKILRDQSFILTIATNQPGPAKGQWSKQAVERTNAKLIELLKTYDIEISILETCMHHPVGGPGGDVSLIQDCDCRKPKPGMAYSILHQLQLQAERCWMVGDSLSDVQCGQAARMKTALIFASNRCELCPLRNYECTLSSSVAPIQPTVYGASLLEVANAIVARQAGTL